MKCRDISSLGDCWSAPGFYATCMVGDRVADQLLGADVPSACIYSDYVVLIICHPKR